eukprot:6173368-Pleurochrysis_carterae.AAC.6
MLDSCTAPRRVRRARDATMACSPLVSAAWLSARLAAASVKGGAGGAISNVNVRDIESAVRVLDASWYLPTMKRNGREEYEERRIPTAAFFDIDETDDQSGEQQESHAIVCGCKPAAGRLYATKQHAVSCLKGTSAKPKEACMPHSSAIATSLVASLLSCQARTAPAPAYDRS